MPRKSGTISHDQTIEETINRAGSIGALERLAGVGTSDIERFGFWQQFTTLPATEGLDAGVAELKQRIRAQEARHPTRTTQTKKDTVKRGRFIQATDIRDADAPGYFDLTLDRTKVARALGGRPCSRVLAGNTP